MDARSVCEVGSASRLEIKSKKTNVEFAGYPKSPAGTF